MFAYVRVSGKTGEGGEGGSQNAGGLLQGYAKGLTRLYKAIQGYTRVFGFFKMKKRRTTQAPMAVGSRWLTFARITVAGDFGIGCRCPPPQVGGYGHSGKLDGGRACGFLE
jgi:hypothetical protein